MLWDKLDPFFDFQGSAIAGVLFEIPGGSPYVAYLDMVEGWYFGATRRCLHHRERLPIDPRARDGLAAAPASWVYCGQKEVRAVGPVRPHLPIMLRAFR